MITVGFIGLGLIGGSIARALKNKCGKYRTIAYNRSHEPLDTAVAEKIIDEGTYEVDNTFAQCDIIFLCTPVEHNSTYLAKLKDIISDNCIITDVGSVKGYIYNTVKELHMEKCFIGGHPMAGSEKTGYAASTDTLLENAYFAITPTSESSQASIDMYKELVTDTGAIPVIVDPYIHDFAVAGISHVPHLIASSLVNLVADNDTPDELMRMLAAGGFKDITRIASSSADMWSQICVTNEAAISKLLAKYIESLRQIKEYVDNKDRDAIADMFVRSKEYRDSINLREKGLILENHSLLVNIVDKEGSLNEITSILSDNKISIKNIEIIHNREYRDGVLMIDFYDKTASELANNILNDNGYTITK